MASAARSPSSAPGRVAALLLAIAASGCGGDTEPARGAEPLRGSEPAATARPARRDAPAARSGSPREAWDAPSIATRRRGGTWLACVAWDGAADAIEMRLVASDGGKPLRVHQSPTRVLGTAVAADDADTLHVAWSEQQADGWALRGLEIAAPERVSAPGAGAGRSLAERLGSAGEPFSLAAEPGVRHLEPRLVADSAGGLLLCWVRGDADGFSIQGRYRPPGGAWGPPSRLSAGGRSCWEPSAASTGPGRFAVAWDAAAGGDYDVLLARLVAHEDGRLEVLDRRRVTDTPRFEAHASLAAHGERLYVAYDVGPEDWGREGSTNRLEVSLHGRRHIEIVAVEGDGVAPIAVSPVDGMSELLKTGCEQPRLAVDASGSLVLAWRGLPLPPSLDDPEDPDFADAASRKEGGKGWRTSIWFSYASRFDGRAWELGGRHQVRTPDSEGRCDAPIALAAFPEGGFAIAVVGDGREVGATSQGTQPPRPDGSEWWCPVTEHATTVRVGGFGPLPLRAPVALGPSRPLAALRPEDLAAPAPASELRGPDVRRPDVRREVGGRSLRLALGDLHRHTDISRCSSNWDGPIGDALRYACDVAPLDFLAITDHFEHMTPYDWWRSMSLAEAYDTPGRLVNLRAYERADALVGHRNVISGDGAPPLVSYPGVHDTERDAAEAKTTKALWALLEGRRVLTIPHTPAGMFPRNPSVFDWSGFEPRHDRLVEVFQSYRGSSEAAEEPRAIPGLHPQRYVRPNLDLGMHFGLIASSDHQTSHGAFAGAWVEELTRESVFDALHARRTFASTVQASLWCEWGGVPMGVSAPVRDVSAAAASGGEPAFLVEVDGFGRRIEAVELIVDGRLHAMRAVAGAAASVRFPLEPPEAGTRYAYARVRFEDGELMWGSPIRLNGENGVGADGLSGPELGAQRSGLWPPHPLARFVGRRPGGDDDPER